MLNIRKSNEKLEKQSLQPFWDRPRRLLVRHRAKVFSCLRSLSEEIYQQGLARLEADLVRGSVSFTSKYMLLWAKKDSGKDLVKHTKRRKVR